ncbi:MAG: nucleotidyltransferase domain-containing protein [Thermodesulfobacteriota bacterium]
MSDGTEELLKRVVDIIVDAVSPEQIILFGSRARGDAGEHSDLDLLVVESRPFDKNRSRRRELALLWRLLAHVPVPKDILLYSRDEVEFWKGSLNNVVGRALREGRVLYERS